MNCSCKECRRKCQLKLLMDEENANTVKQMNNNFWTLKKNLEDFKEFLTLRHEECLLSKLISILILFWLIFSLYYYYIIYYILYYIIINILLLYYLLFYIINIVCGKVLPESNFKSLITTFPQGLSVKRATVGELSMHILGCYK